MVRLLRCATVIEDDNGSRSSADTPAPLAGTLFFNIQLWKPILLTLLILISLNFGWNYWFFCYIAVCRMQSSKSIQ